MSLTFAEVTQNGYGYSSILRAIERLILMRSTVLPHSYEANFEGITRALWDLGEVLRGSIPPPATSTIGDAPPNWSEALGDYLPGGEPADGSFWFDTRSGRLMVAYAGEWYQTNGAEGVVAVGPAPARETPGALWFDTRSGSMMVYLDAVTTSGEPGWYQTNGSVLGDAININLGTY